MTNEGMVKQIQGGGHELMGELYAQNMPVIRMIAEKLTTNSEDFKDAMQDAYFGLVEAVNAYDESKGFKFITYASYHMKAAILRGKGAVQRVPEWLLTRARKIRRAEHELIQRLQRTPTTAEIAYRTGLTIEEVEYTIKAVMPPVGIDTPLTEDLTIADTISDNSIDFENEVAAADEVRRLHDVVAELPELERRIIQLYYFRGLTYRDIGERLNISIEQARRQKEKGLRLLQRPQMVRKLREREIDRLTPFYRHRGVQSFNNTWISSTESIVFEREQNRRDIDRVKRD